MLLFLLAYLGGVLTIVSPCILPVLPFVFARAGQPFIRSSLPMLVGMAATFAAVATLGRLRRRLGGTGQSVWPLPRLGASGGIRHHPAVSGALGLPDPATGLCRCRLSQSSDRKSRDGGSTVVTSLLLGVATGLLWAPCAGPVLGLILTGAALNGASVSTTLLLLAYALGAATSLALALLVGGRVYKAMKNSLGIGQRVRQGVGVAVLVAVVAIFFGADTGFLTQASLASTANLEQNLLDKLHPKPEEPSVVMKGGDAMMSGNNTMMMAAKPGLADALPIGEPCRR